MRLAQQLYEGIDIKGHGTIGLITYLRTDSIRVAEEADQAARRFVAEQYGAEYASQGEEIKKGNGKIQDAHEAIRPTNIELTPVKVKDSLSQRSFPPLSVNLEAVCGKPHEQRRLRRQILSAWRQAACCLPCRLPG